MCVVMLRQRKLFDGVMSKQSLGSTQYGILPACLELFHVTILLNKRSVLL